MKDALHVPGSNISIFQCNNLKVDQEYYNKWTKNIHFTAAKDTFDYLMKAAFMVKAYQFAHKNACWYLHEDLSPFLRYLKGVLDAAKNAKILSKFFLSTRGCAIFFNDKSERGEFQIQITEPWAQILCHMTKEKHWTCPDIWDNIRNVNKHTKPKPGKMKYFNYKMKKFVIENRPGYVRPSKSSGRTTRSQQR